MRPYIRGPYAQASCALVNKLKIDGIVAEVGYDSDPKKRRKKLMAYVRSENVFRVPREWRGFSVTVHVNNDLPSASRGDGGGS